jgi:hypothetical protein
MRYKFILSLALFSLFGCAKSEKLDDEEINYVQITMALTKARISSHDSLQLVWRLDSVYKKFGTTKDGYKKRTTDFSEDPQRAQIIFKAIGDSMNLK